MNELGLWRGEEEEEEGRKGEERSQRKEGDVVKSLFKRDSSRDFFLKRNEASDLRLRPRQKE